MEAAIELEDLPSILLSTTHITEGLYLGSERLVDSSKNV